MSSLFLPNLRCLLFILLLFAFHSQASASRFVRAAAADGFDFPVGKPDAAGYYKARGFQPYGHLGEDWNGRGGGNTDLGAPVYSIGHGVVVFSADAKLGWGNVVIVRHAYRQDDGRIEFIDSLYGHLDERYVELYDEVERGQLIGTIGTNRGMYWAHLHFEVRKNIYIGMDRSKHARGFGNYFNPTSFIEDHRELRRESRGCRIPIDTFDAPFQPADGRPDRPSPAPETFPEEDEPSGLEREINRLFDRHNFHPDPDENATAEKRPYVPFERDDIDRDAEQDQDERDKIRSFWSRARL